MEYTDFVQDIPAIILFWFAVALPHLNRIRRKDVSDLTKEIRANRAMIERIENEMRKHHPNGENNDEDSNSNGHDDTGRVRV